MIWKSFLSCVKDDKINTKITTKESPKREAERMVREIQEKCTKLENEKQLITKTTAKFAHFLNTNAIAPYNDSFEEYLMHLIENEKSLSKHGSKNGDVIKGLRKMLDSYKEEKKF